MSHFTIRTTKMHPTLKPAEENLIYSMERRKPKYNEFKNKEKMVAIESKPMTTGFKKCKELRLLIKKQTFSLE